jgi:chaperonin GroEL (HSP60 family)
LARSKLPEVNALKKVDSRLLPLKHERVPTPDIYLDGKPVLVLDRRTTRRTKADAITDNLAAVEFMRDLAKTIFGPRRLIKLVSSEEGKYPLSFITSDLQSVLKRIKIKHPAAQIIAGAGITAHREKGDGCVSTILLAASILQACKPLLKKKTHANQVIDGLSLAYHKVTNLAPKLAVAEMYDPQRVIENGIRNSLEGKLLSFDLDLISRLLWEAVRIVGIENLMGPDGTDIVDVKKSTGGSLTDSQVVDGIVLTQEIPSKEMPRRVEDAKIALIQGELRLPNKKINRYQDYSFEFDKPDRLSGFNRSNRSFLESLVAKILEVNANVILVQEGVDDFLFEYFAKRGILVIRRFPQVEFERVSRSLGAKMIPDPSLLTSEDLGWAKLVEERKVGKDTLVFITGCKVPKTVDIVIRGANKRTLDDVERVMKGAIKAAVTVAKDPRLVWGGGAFEQELAMKLYDYSEEIPDRRQLVIRAVAEAFESLPAMLAETVGLEAVDITAELRRRHSLGEASAGVDVNNNSIALMSSLGLLDSLDVKLQVIKSAFETAITILRADEVLVGRDLPEPERAYVQRIKGTSKEALKAKDAYID